jgi:ABC-type polysaccharide/polyol phosphate export permease
MHMSWNSPLQLPLYAKYLVLGTVAWFFILEFIQTGLKQVGDAQGAVVAPVAVAAT